MFIERRRNSHYEEARREVLSRNITLVDIPYERFLQEYDDLPSDGRKLFAQQYDAKKFRQEFLEMKAETEALAADGQGLTLGHLVTNLLAHFEQLTEDTLSEGSEDVLATLKRIRILKIWMGNDNLNNLKSLHVVKEFPWDEEVQSILLSLNNDYKNVVEQIKSSEHSFYYDEKDHEKYSPSPMIDEDHLRHLYQIADTSTRFMELREALFNGL